MAGEPPAQPRQSRNDGLIFDLNDVVKPEHGQLRGGDRVPTPVDAEVVQGWPYNPVFDANGRAVEVTDLDDAIRNGKWQDSCRDIIAKNKYLLEASTCFFCRDYLSRADRKGSWHQAVRPQT